MLPPPCLAALEVDRAGTGVDGEHFAGALLGARIGRLLAHAELVLLVRVERVAVTRRLPEIFDDADELQLTDALVVVDEVLVGLFEPVVPRPQLGPRLAPMPSEEMGEQRVFGNLA